MKRIFLMVLVMLASGSVGAMDVNFMGGLVYRSEYSDQVGRAAVYMTENPEYVLISIDRNKCSKRMCELLGIPGDMRTALFQLHKVEDSHDQIIYQAVPVPLTQLAHETYVSDYEGTLESLTITLVINMTDKNWNGGTDKLFSPKSMILNVIQSGRLRQYDLNKTMRY